ncbi:hypothetical protein HYV12_02050 [Candidatus Dojkabacteria bacterium]|nr:hypothetical protein [Candidatus Dojkabacteria bacterium]
MSTYANNETNTISPEIAAKIESLSEKGQVLIATFPQEAVISTITNDRNVKEIVTDKEAWETLFATLPRKTFERFVNDIYNNSREFQFELEREEYKGPRFKFPEKINTPQDISTVFGQRLQEKLYGIETAKQISVIISENNPTKIWIITYGNYDPNVSAISIEVMEEIKVNEKTYKKYEYQIENILGFPEHMQVIDTFGRKILNRAKLPKEQTPAEDYSFIDSLEPEPREAKDNLRSEKYSREAIAFRRKMEDADKVMRQELNLENLDEVNYVSQTLRRFAKRVGRDRLMTDISELRKLFSDYIVDANFPFSPISLGHKLPFPEETVLRDIVLKSGNKELLRLLDETEYETQLPFPYDNKPKVTKVGFLSTLITLLNVERAYTSAVSFYPWNSTGPEPFVSLIDVFWFSFSFSRLKKHHEAIGRLARKYNNKKSKAYAQSIRRKRGAFVEQNVKDWDLLFATTEDVPIPSRILKNFNNPDPLEKYLSASSKEGLIEIAKRIRKLEDSPSELFLLLWKTLKWAQPSPWHLHTDSLDRRELSDERTINIKDRELTDAQMRLILNGESFKGTSHLLTGYENEISEVVVARLLRAADEMNHGENITLQQIYEQAKKYLEQVTPQMQSSKESVKEFNSVIKRIPLKKLVKYIDKLPLTAKNIVLHRLGYDVTMHSIGKSIESAINQICNNKPGLYYHTLQLTAEVLGSPRSKAKFSKLSKLTEENDKRIEKYIRNLDM